MTTPLDIIRYHSGIAGEEVAELVDSLEQEVSYLREQVEKLTAERDAWKIDAIHGGNAAYLREELAALAEQNEKLRKVLVEAKSMVGHPDNIAIINSALSLPNLATPVLNRIKAEAYREAAGIVGPEDSYQDDWFKAKADSCAKLRAKADELEKSK